MAGPKIEISNAMSILTVKVKAFYKNGLQPVLADPHHPWTLSSIKNLKFADRQVLVRNILMVANSTAVSQEAKDNLLHELEAYKILRQNHNMTSLNDISEGNISLIVSPKKIHDYFGAIYTDDVDQGLRWYHIPTYPISHPLKSAFWIAKGLTYNLPKALFYNLPKAMFFNNPVGRFVTKWAIAVPGTTYALYKLGQHMFNEGGHNPLLGFTYLALGAVNWAYFKAKSHVTGVEPHNTLGKAENWLVKKGGLPLFLLDVGAITAVVKASDLYAAGMVDAVGYYGVAGVAALTLLSAGKFIAKNTKEMIIARCGMVAPGSIAGMKKLMNWTAKATMLDATYWFTRLNFMLPGLTNAFMNACYWSGTWEGIGALLGAPLLSLALCIKARAKGPVVPEVKSIKGRIQENLMAYAPLWGLGIGMGISATMGSHMLQAFTMFWGSLAFFFSESHALSFSFNTGLDFMKGLKASSDPVMGVAETKPLANDVKTVCVRPDTGVRESSFGLLFTAILGAIVQTLYLYDKNVNQKTIGKIRGKREERELTAAYHRAIEAAGNAPKSEQKKEELLKAYHEELAEVREKAAKIENELIDRLRALAELVEDQALYATRESQAITWIQGRVNAGELEFKDPTADNIRTWIRTKALAPNRNWSERKALVKWVQGKRKDIYNAITRGESGKDHINQAAMSIEKRYQRVADNLKYAAGVMRKMAVDLRGEIDARSGADALNGWFDLKEKKYIDAEMNSLRAKADQMFTFAEKLERDISDPDKPISMDLLSRFLIQDVGIDGFDEERSGRITMTVRKAGAGDDNRVRKTENLAAYYHKKDWQLFTFEYDEVNGQGFKTHDEVAGTWTWIENPSYDPLAPDDINHKDYLKSKKVLWIENDHVLTTMEQEKGPTKEIGDLTSTNRHAKVIDNPPTEAEGFEEGKKTLKVALNGKEVVLKEGKYYYVKGKDQNVVPDAKKVVLRNGRSVSVNDFIDILKKEGFRNVKMLEEQTHIPGGDAPKVEDKNDQQNVSQEAALLKKFRDNIPDFFVQIAYRKKWGKARKYEGDTVTDCAMEFSYGKKVIPYVKDPEALREQEAVPLKNSDGQPHKLAKAIAVVKKGKLVSFSLVYGDVKNNKALTDSLFYTHDGTIPEISPVTGQQIPGVEIHALKKTDWPMYLNELGIPATDGTHILNATDFQDEATGTVAKERGDAWYIWDAHKKRFISGEGDRMFWRDQITAIREKEGNGKLGEEHKINVGYMTPIKRAWAWAIGLKPGDKLAVKADGTADINTSGLIYVNKENGTVSFTKVAGSKETRGNVGLLVAGGEAISVQLRDLKPHGYDKPANQGKHAVNVRDILPAADNKDELVVTEARVDTESNPLDASRYIYKVNMDAIRRENLELAKWLEKIDYRDVKVRVAEEGVYVTWTPDGVKGWKDKEASQPVLVPAKYFVDHMGKTLLHNKETHMRKLDDLYQWKGDPANMPDDVKEFMPRLDHFMGRDLMLRVDKVYTYRMKKTRGIKKFEERYAKEHNGEKPTYRIVPSAAYSVAKVGDKYVPLNEAITHADQIDGAECGISDAQYTAVVNEQNRLGFPDKLYFKLRDIYFYGLLEYTNISDRLKYGTNFGLEWFKGLNNEGINTGRTYTSWWKYVMGEHDTFIATNNPYSKKMLKNTEIEGSGVSEDEQAKQDARMRGERLLVIRTPEDALNFQGGNNMPAENSHGNINIQDAYRYDRSEQNFRQRYKLLTDQLMKTAFWGNEPSLIKMFEARSVAAGRFWFKVPIARLINLLASPTFLVFNGYVPIIPVDQHIVLSTLILRSIYSIGSFSLHMISLGLTPFTGLFHQQRVDYAIMWRMMKDSFKQWILRNQYANFQLTAGGFGSRILTQDFWYSGAMTLYTAMGLATGSYHMLNTGEAMSPGLVFNMVFSALQVAHLGGNMLYMNEVNGKAAAEKEWNAEYAKQIVKPAVQDMFNNCKNTYTSIRAKIDALNIDQTAPEPFANVSYTELDLMRSDLRRRLIEMKAIKEDGTVKVGGRIEDAALMKASLPLIELVNEIDCLIVVKAKRDMLADRTTPTVHSADKAATAKYFLKKVAENTKDFFTGYLAEHAYFRCNFNY